MSTSPAPLVPTVFWSQTPTAIHLKVDVREAEKATIRVKAIGPRIEITATSKINPAATYFLSLDLFAPVIPTPTVAVLPHSFSVSLAKVDSASLGMWPRLLAGEGKVDNKVRVDWDRWIDEDADADAHTEQERLAEKADLKTQFEQLTARQKAGLPLTGGLPGLDGGSGFLMSDTNPALMAIPQKERLKISYLLAYNLMVLCGICLILFLCVQGVWMHFFEKKGGTHPVTGDALVQHSGGLVNALYYGLSTLHSRAGGVQYMVQGLASLEILHAATGLIPGRVLPSFLLNVGRDIILFGCIQCFPSATQSDWSVGALYFLWCLGDLVRFVFYVQQMVKGNANAALIAESWFSVPVLHLLQHVPTQKFFLLWRYTLPLLLLPFGFVTELKVVWEALTEADQVPLFTTGFTVADLLKVYAVLAYLIGAPMLYLAVLAQRKAKLKPTKRGNITTERKEEGKKAQ